MMNNLNNTSPDHLTAGSYLELMTVAELAEYLGIGKNKAYDLLNNGTIKGFRLGCTWKVSLEAVNRFIMEQSEPD